MSTDDSISEDVSSSVALSHDHTSANGGKESEASGVSSEDTASGPAGPEEHRPAVRTLEGFLQVAGDATLTRPSSIPACTISHKIRNLCLRTEEEFGSGKSLPFINPSSLETLRALVQEIQSSGATDPEIWKNCEGRWLHLFQLVEKQYQEQILAQQEQYQCQIQLIQDEIKALVQLQNRQSPTKAEPRPEVTNESRASAPAPGPPASPQLTADPQESSDEGLVTVLSSGYGTLSAWGPSPEAGPPRVPERREGVPWLARQQGGAVAHSPLAESSPQGQHGVPNSAPSPSGAPHATATTGTSPPADKQRLSSQPLTSWAQRQKHRQKKPKATQNGSVPMKRGEERESACSPKGHVDSVDDPQSMAPSLKPAHLRRSDSLVSEASGLTYWKLDESDLYRPLPDSFETTSSFLLMQDVSLSQPLADEARPSLSLKEIYRGKHKGEPKCQEWDSLITSDASSLQVLTQDPAGAARQSERTSGFTSPSRFSSPSLPGRARPCPATGAEPVSPDWATALRSDTDTDCVSNTSSLSTQPGPERSPVPPVPPPVQRGSGEDEGSRTAAVTLRPERPPAREQRLNGGGREASTSLDDPVVLSLLRQNLREKHARHVADLRAYYEAEIATLKEKLDLASLPLDVERSNRILLERCEHLERAVTEASGRIRELETRNRHLERQLAEWPERYEAAGSAVRALQRHLEESKRSGREKEASMARLRSRVRQLEETAQSACREADEKEARGKKEREMLQGLLQEYDSLRKDHERVKDNLVATENKLFDASEEISELKRVISKLEAQVKQLEHENMAKSRQAPKSHAQPSGAGLFHHPDLLMSPGKRQHDVECSTKTPGLHDKTAMHAKGRRSPPEREQAEEACARRDSPLAPVVKALIQMEDTKATEGRALARSSYSRLGKRRPTVAFVDSMWEPLLEQGGSGLRAQRSLSPEGHRSSSLPPRTQRAGLPSTPTKRETLIQPLSAKSSPKRCPTENVSTAFGRPLPCQHLHNRLSLRFDQRDFGSSLPSASSARTRPQIALADRSEANARSGTGWAEPAGSSDAEELAMPPGPEEQTAADSSLLANLSCYSHVQSLADAERLFDELTQEKQRIEAALSRIPGAGARVSLQTKLDEVTLETRLEKVNRDLGCIRMTLKRFHVLRSSVNT
ncbi:M-phase phosphoprotein 9 [Brachyhypopomus gauderio]|uniref:M-phase phosphoprotein 9 n=1 Tax=Brachyhypopomus gauderio TaxID=698409 RepID=UPI0040427CC8